MGPWDIVVLILVSGLLGLAVFVLVRSHKEGKSSCGCQTDCSGCPGCTAGKATEKEPEKCSFCARKAPNDERESHAG